MRTLKKGLEGLDIAVWQKFLGQQGHRPGTIDGIFGDKTDQATKDFQHENGLTPDGKVGTKTLTVAANLGFFKTLVRIPQDVNQGLTMVSQTTLLNIFGAPCTTAGGGCHTVTSQKVRNLLDTENIGTFSATGLKPALTALRKVFSNVQTAEPELYRKVGTAGMLCCRRVALVGGGFAKTFSNHAWGLAIDFKINGELDERADGLVQYGLLLLHPFLKAEKFFWGAGFGLAVEDSMHFEASEDLINEWKGSGLI